MSHRPTFANHLKSLGRTIFRDNRINKICPENPCQQLCFSVCRFFPTELSPSYFPRFPVHPPSHRSRLAPSQRSSPQAISHNFPSVHPLVASMSLVPLGALPKLFPTISLPSTRSLLPYRSFPPDLSPSYFPRFPSRPPCRHSRIAPSHRSSPQAISHGFPSVHPVVTPVSLLRTGALPKLFPTASLPSTLSSLPYRSFPPNLSPSHFPQRPFHPPCRHSHIAPSHRNSPQAISLPSTLSSFPFRPPCGHSRIAPSDRSSPQAISYDFPSVHPVVIPVSLLPTGALPKLFPTVFLPSTLSRHSRIAPSHRSSPQAISHGFPSVRLYRSSSYFPRLPFRPPCHHSRITPSHRSSPQAISHGFPSVHPLIIPVALLPTGALP